MTPTIRSPHRHQKRLSSRKRLRERIPCPWKLAQVSSRGTREDVLPLPHLSRALVASRAEGTALVLGGALPGSFGMLSWGSGRGSGHRNAACGDGGARLLHVAPWCPSSQPSPYLCSMTPPSLSIGLLGLEKPSEIIGSCCPPALPRPRACGATSTRLLNPCRSRDSTTACSRAGQPFPEGVFLIVHPHPGS